MKMPGFTAEKSLYKIGEFYRLARIIYQTDGNIYPANGDGEMKCLEDLVSQCWEDCTPVKIRTRLQCLQKCIDKARDVCKDKGRRFASIDGWGDNGGFGDAGGGGNGGGGGEGNSGGGDDSGFFGGDSSGGGEGFEAEHGELGGGSSWWHYLSKLLT